MNGVCTVTADADASPANDVTSVYVPAVSPGSSAEVATPSAPVVALTDREPTANVTVFPSSAAPAAFVSFAVTRAASVNCAVVAPVFVSTPGGGGKHVVSPTM